MIRKGSLNQLTRVPGGEVCLVRPALTLTLLGASAPTKVTLPTTSIKFA